ncbi:ATP-binding protein [Catenibacterium sp.]|jgi:adenylate kinase family enzyme|uniref:ATP-binding protein n=1 Tax=Catenibacterium sp. TaxID=2049022 RepID=UPI002065029C|nr:ATP-binding protein [Catenibacterium sp.]MEE0820991.1 ATP-binding protein [Catenibacterium sp.]UWI21525.1 MAG: AAA domain protein [Bacteriophage sp.]DAE99219.1 MAG TPA: AAA domain protein [Caudoviricetes sp.]
MAAETIAIVGESGTGKSTSLRNLNPEETFIISTTGKPLPFRAWKKKYIPIKIEGKNVSGNYYVSSKWDQILKILQIIDKMMPQIKQVIIDDFQYVLSYEFVDRATEVGYTKFSELAQHAMEILRYSEKMREDCKMIFLTHSENVGDNVNPKFVIKTVGKLLSEKVTLEGLFTYIFFTKVSEGDSGRMEYKLITNNDGTCVAKTSFGMFEDLEIDNDLNEIIHVIDAYNEGE